MTDYAPPLERAFSLTVGEGGCEIDFDPDALPESVRGTYYVNGPGRFARGNLTYRHWLDGDGLVSSLRIGAGGLRSTSRFVRSTRLQVEEEAGRAVFRSFGTNFPGDRLQRGVGLQSPVNVSVYPYAGALLAFGEQGLPWRLDADTLETRGAFDFQGALNEVSPFAAHPKFDAATGEMFNFGISFSASPSLSLYRFDAGGRLVFRRRAPLPYACSLHDFALSPDYAVFHLGPYLLDMDRLLHRQATLLDSLSWEPDRKSYLMIVCRKSGSLCALIPAGHGYSLHTVNAFHQQRRLCVDVIEYAQPIYPQYQPVPDLYHSIGPGGPVRYVFDLDTGALVDRLEMGYRLAPDFPAVDSRAQQQPYRHFWVLGISKTGCPGRKFFDQLVHLRWDAPEAADVFQAGPEQYLSGEPVFIPDPVREEAGTVICQIFDARRQTTSFGFFDALHIAEGPAAVVRLPRPLPIGFHACFVPHASDG